MTGRWRGDGSGEEGEGRKRGDREVERRERWRKQLKEKEGR